jgi:putative membrane protein
MQSEEPIEQFATPRRLHPASILLGIDVGQVFQWGLIPLFALITSGGRAVVVLLGLILLLTPVVRVLDWRRRRYSFDGAELRVESGILGRSLRSLDVDRIQQIEIRRKLLHRVLGLAAVRVETAGSASEPEVQLRVVSESDARALRTAVRAAKSRGRGNVGTDAGPLDPATEGRFEAPDGATRSEPTRVLAVPAAHVVLASVTGARLLVLPAFVAAAVQLAGEAFEQFADQVDARLEELGQAAEPMLAGGPDWTLAALLALVVTAAAVGTAVVVGLLRDGGFRIDRVDDDLHVSRGLLSTQESLVPLARVQLVVIRRNWLRRFLGFASVEVRSAGGSAGKGGSVTIPLLPDAAVDPLLSEILDGVPGVPVLTGHPRGALRRSVVRRVIRTGIFVAVVGIALHLAGWLDVVTGSALASLVVLGAILGLVEYRHLGHGLTDRVVASRRGALSTVTEVTPLRKVQAVHGMAGPFQRRLGLGSLAVHVAGPTAKLSIRDAGGSRVEELHARLTTRAARPG